MDPDSTAVLWHAAGLAMLTAAVAMDVTVQRIPNAAVGWGAAAAIVLSALPGGIGVHDALLGLLAGFLVLLPLYFLRVMGEGDVKLLGGVGAFLGFPGVLAAALAALVAGGVLALARALRTHSLRNLNLGTGLHMLIGNRAGRRRTEPADLPGRRVPHAIAIAAGAVTQVLLAGALGGSRLL